MQHFDNYLKETHPQRDARPTTTSSASTHAAEQSKHVYVRKWMRTKHSIIFRLSDNSFQVLLCASPCCSLSPSLSLYPFPLPLSLSLALALRPPLSPSPSPSHSPPSLQLSIFSRLPSFVPSSSISLAHCHTLAQELATSSHTMSEDSRRMGRKWHTQDGIRTRRRVYGGH
jgi:hypothetical protein